MPMLDVFDSDIFGVVSLTAAINKLPYVPGRLGRMNLFRRQGINTPTVIIEEEQGKLALIPNTARGTMINMAPKGVRKAHAFLVPHLQLNDAVYAADVQGMRAFGSESDVEAVVPVVNNKMELMRQSHEITLEYHRIGALSGIVLDADGTTEIVNYFDRFGITENEVDMDLGTDDMKLKALEVIRIIKRVLGATPFKYVHAMCGDAFFDALISNESVKGAYEIYRQSGNFGLTQQNGEGGFEFGDIIWENYSGYVGDREFIGTNECRFFPVGVPDLFWTWDAPADFIETVNTIGKPVYAKQERMKWDVGVELHTQSNPLCTCTRPSVLVKGNNTAASGS